MSTRLRKRTVSVPPYELLKGDLIDLSSNRWVIKDIKPVIDDYHFELDLESKRRARQDKKMVVKDTCLVPVTLQEVI